MPIKFFCNIYIYDGFPGIWVLVNPQLMELQRMSINTLLLDVNLIVFVVNKIFSFDGNDSNIIITIITVTIILLQ